jgi:hypothetical protein
MISNLLILVVERHKRHESISHNISESSYRHIVHSLNLLDMGDQPFWGERVHDRGVGPPPIPIDVFSFPKLISAINFMLDPKVNKNLTSVNLCISPK